jgi:hypothetical protein
MIIQKNFLHNEYCNSLAKLRAGFHYPKAKRNNFGREEEIDHVRGIILDECANNTKGSQAKVFEGSRLGCGIEKRVEEQWNMGCVFINRLSEKARNSSLPFKKSALVSLWEATH